MRDVKGLLKQVTRILNESDVYMCEFVFFDGMIVGLDDFPNDQGEYLPFPIEPGLWLESVKGA